VLDTLANLKCGFAILNSFAADRDFQLKPWVGDFGGLLPAAFARAA